MDAVTIYGEREVAKHYKAWLTLYLGTQSVIVACYWSKDTQGLSDKWSSSPDWVPSGSPENINTPGNT